MNWIPLILAVSALTMSCRSMHTESRALDGNVVKVVDGKFHRLVFGMQDGKVKALICENQVSVRFLTMAQCNNPTIYGEPLEKNAYLKNLNHHLGLSQNPEAVEAELNDVRTQMKEFAKAQIDENITAKTESLVLGSDQVLGSLSPLIAEMRLEEQRLEIKLVRLREASKLYAQIEKALDSATKENLLASARFLSPERYVLGALSEDFPHPIYTEAGISFSDDIRPGYYVPVNYSNNSYSTGTKKPYFHAAYGQQVNDTCPIVVEQRERSILSVRLLGDCAGQLHYLACEDRVCRSDRLELTFTKDSEITLNGRDYRHHKAAIAGIREGSFSWEKTFHSYYRDSQSNVCEVSLDANVDGNGNVSSVLVTPHNGRHCFFIPQETRQLTCSGSKFSCESDDFLVVFLSSRVYETVYIQGDTIFVTTWRDDRHNNEVYPYAYSVRMGSGGGRYE